MDFFLSPDCLSSLAIGCSQRTTASKTPGLGLLSLLVVLLCKWSCSRNGVFPGSQSTKHHLSHCSSSSSGAWRLRTEYALHWKKPIRPLQESFEPFKPFPTLNLGEGLFRLSNKSPSNFTQLVGEGYRSNRNRGNSSERF